MLWLRSSIFHVLPASSERYSALRGGTASMKAYTTSGLEGATATATRPHGFTGRPVLAVLRSVQVAPPSVVLNSAQAPPRLVTSPPARHLPPPTPPHPSPTHARCVT